VSDRSHDGRHRANHQAPSKPHRVIAGLALPTAAAITLTFTVAGAAVATSSQAQSDTFLQNAAAMSTATTAHPIAAATAPARHSREKKARAHAQAITRSNQLKAAANKLAAERKVTVARSVARKKLANRAIVAKRAELARTKALARTTALVRSQTAARSESAARRKAQASAPSKAPTTSTAPTQSTTPAQGWRLPVTNPVVTSGFGYRWGRLHAGEDFAVSVGTPLMSMSTGTVTQAGPEGGYGTLVKIKYWDGTVSYFGHMSGVSVNAGEKVVPGQVVGKSGNTGNSTGPHLHLEIHPGGGEAVDPVAWMAKR